MTNHERYMKYIKEYCENCKNNKGDLCDIRIFALNDLIITKCIHFERISNECITRKCKNCGYYNKCFEKER